MKNIFILMLFIMITMSCRSNKYIPNTETFKDHMKGMQFYARMLDESHKEGEIIAINEIEIYLLLNDSKSDKKYTILARKDIDYANVKIYNKSVKLKKLKTIGVFNYIANMFHGLWMLYTLPLNIITNSSVLGSAAGYNYVVYPNNISWREIHKFARFPQGLPPEITLDEIR